MEVVRFPSTETEPPKPTARTFDDVTAEFVRYQGMYSDDGRGARSHERILGRYLTGRIFTEIKATDIEDIFASRRRLVGVKSATLNRYRAFLSRMFNWAIERHYHPGPNPALVVKRFREPRAEPRILMPGEARALVRAANPAARLAIVLALYTGGRRGELWKLTPADVDVQRGLIRFRRETTKSKRERHVPIAPRLADFLLRHGINDPSRRWVIERRSRQFGGLRRGLVDARTAAGLPWVTWVTLRHTFAGWFLTNGGEISRLQEFLGHANPMITMIYKHFIPDRGRDVARLIGPPAKLSGGIEIQD